MTGPVSGATPLPAAAPVPAAATSIDPRLAELIRSLPAEQQAKALAAVQAMSPEQQQQLLARLSASQQPAPGAGSPQGIPQAQQGAAQVQPGTPDSSATPSPAELEAAPGPEPTPAPAPPVAHRRYRVRAGDNLSVIAARHGLTWQQLYRANREAVGANPNLIHPGLKLVIPRD